MNGSISSAVEETRANSNEAQLPSKLAQKRFDEIRPRVYYRWSTESYFERLSPHEQERLGDSLRDVLSRFGDAPAMHRHLYGGSVSRSIIEVAHRLDMLTDREANWLLREGRETFRVRPSKVDIAIQRGDLVLNIAPEALYWEGKYCAVDWVKYPVLWNFLMKAAQLALVLKPIGPHDIIPASSDKTDLSIVSKRINRLGNTDGVPLNLLDRFERVAGKKGYQRLNLSRDQIHIYETEAGYFD